MFQWMIQVLIQNGENSFKSFTNANNDLRPPRNDILRKHKIIPEKPPSPTPIIQEAIEKARELAHENRLEDKDLDELDDLEDEEDDTFLQKYRWVRSRNMMGLLSDYQRQQPAPSRTLYYHQRQCLQPGLPFAKARLFQGRYGSFQQGIRSRTFDLVLGHQCGVSTVDGAVAGAG